MGNTTTTTVELPVTGSGEALELVKGTTTFGLTGVSIQPRPGGEKATVMWVPDPDNENNTIFWVRGIEGVEGLGLVTLELTYTGE
jgi:hypothetical protein